MNSKKIQKICIYNVSLLVLLLPVIYVISKLSYDVSVDRLFIHKFFLIFIALSFGGLLILLIFLWISGKIILKKRTRIEEVRKTKQYPIAAALIGLLIMIINILFREENGRDLGTFIGAFIFFTFTFAIFYYRYEVSVERKLNYPLGFSAILILYSLIPTVAGLLYAVFTQFFINTVLIFILGLAVSGVVFFFSERVRWFE